jgi:hypothetical protein
MQRHFALTENDFSEPGPDIWYSQSGTYIPYKRIVYAIERTNPTNLAGQQRAICYKYEISVPGQLFKFYSS